MAEEAVASEGTPEATTEPSWPQLADATLLTWRICDLGLRLEGSPLEPLVRKVEEELDAKGILLRPAFYLGDEWFSPEGVPAVAIPFYLAHPRLVALELKMMFDVEGGDPTSCLRLLRHECGHAIEHGFLLQKRKRRRELFGSASTEYDPDTYHPHPYSRSYVQNLPQWYAQAHPDEDWAETFAVWLDPESDWARRYKGWKALHKLEYVDELMRELAGKAPKVKDGPRDYEVHTLRSTLATYYKKRRKLYATEFPDFYDADLRSLFGGTLTSRKGAGAFLRRSRRRILDSVTRWTGERRVTTEFFLKKLADRADTLGLVLSREEGEIALDVAVYLATVATHYRFTGKFKRSV